MLWIRNLRITGNIHLFTKCVNYLVQKVVLNFQRACRSKHQFEAFTCYVDCQPQEQLICSYEFIGPIPQPAIRGQKPQDSYPIIDLTDCRILQTVTVPVTR